MDKFAWPQSNPLNISLKSVTILSESKLIDKN